MKVGFTLCVIILALIFTIPLSQCESDGLVKIRDSVPFSVWLPSINVVQPSTSVYTILPDILDFLATKYKAQIHITYDIGQNNYNVTSVVTISDLNVTMEKNQVVSGFGSSDFIVFLPILGKQNYTYKVKTSYLNYGFLVSEQIQTGMLTVPSYLAWAWAGSVTALVLLSVGSVAAICIIHQRKKKAATEQKKRTG